MDILREECPWDRAQTHATLAPHLVEETYEVLDALASLSGPDDAEGYAHLQEELGDLLFQIVFHARLAAECDRFDLGDVARGVHDKLVHRHPHVFAGVQAEDVRTRSRRTGGDQEEREGQAKRHRKGIPSGLPALMLADKLQPARRARWGSIRPGPETPVPRWRHC